MSTTRSDPPQNPAGAFVPPHEYSAAAVEAAREELAAAPNQLRAAVRGLSGDQLEVRYRNWTIRQIVCHLADSHLHSLIRCKWALTEDHPTIKPYFEDRWAELEDGRTGSIDISLGLFEALHAKYVQFIDTLTPEECNRTFFHPESRRTVHLWETFANYAWHSRHHTAQILWIRQKHGW